MVATSSKGLNIIKRGTWLVLVLGNEKTKFMWRPH